jgi:hypothetical protein
MNLKDDIKQAQPDLLFESHGSIVLLRTPTDDGEAWVEENVVVEDWNHLGGAIAVEPRYVEDIAIGAYQAGLLVEVR